MDNMIFTSEVCGVVLIAPFDKISRPPCSTIRFIVFLSLFFRCFSPFSLYHRTFSLTVYHTKTNTFPDFVQVYFEQHARMNNYMHPLVNKGAKNDMKVSAENALKGTVIFPDYREQKAISAFFARLDHLIALQQQELDKLQSIKKALLEKMFV